MFTFVRFVLSILGKTIHNLFYEVFFKDYISNLMYIEEPYKVNWYFIMSPNYRSLN